MTKAEIIEICCKAFNVKPYDLNRKGRIHVAVLCRTAICKVLKDNFPVTLMDIADLLGHVNHTTVMYSLKRHRDYVDTCYEHYLIPFNKIKNQLHEQD